MASKFDLLREGKSIEFEPGVSGRLNPQSKRLELSTGEILDASHDPDFFPQNEQELNLSRQKENVERNIVKSPLGEFGHQFSTQGLIGSGRDWIDYATLQNDEYQTKKQAEQQVSNRISEESPYISAGAKAASFIPDIALTRGMSGLIAAPLLTAASSGSRLATDTQEVLGETALAAAGGGLLDKATGWLGKVAQRRGEIRSFPEKIQSVTNSNRLGLQATNEANALQNQEFNALKLNVKNVNESRLLKHQADLNARQNRMIESQNAYEQAKVARDTEVIRLKNQAEIAKAQRSADASRLDAEYKSAKSAADIETKRLSDEFKLAQNQYQESLKALPELQKQAQQEYSKNVLKNASEIEKNFPKNSRIATDEIGVDEFIDKGINKTGLAGSRDANQATRILRSVFPEGELMGGRELSKRYKALEDAIQRSNPEVQTVLKGFKEHLGQRLPSILENSIAYNKIVPLLKRTLENDVRSILGEINFAGRGSGAAKDSITKLATSNASNIIKNGLTPANFIKKVQSGDMAQEIANKIMTVDDFLIDLSPSNLNFIKKQGTLPQLFEEAQRKHAYFVSELTKKLQNKLAKYEIKAMESARTASQKLGKDVKKTYGLAEPVPTPTAPSSPSSAPYPSAPAELPSIPPIQLPSPVNAPQTPPIPLKPSLMNEPTPNAPHQFIPQPEPILAPAQNMTQRTGDLLEKNILGGNELGNNSLSKGVGALGKLAGLKYLLGSTALPLEAGYIGMKGLTSPTAMGQAARMTFKQGGIQAIESWARKYPSYHDGILENPQERRSLTKEIEDDFQIPLEQKAVMQSKINRGKPLQERL